MPENKASTGVGLLRLLYYVFASLSFFLVFLLAVTMSPNRADPGLILTFIIAVLLLIFMLYTSQQLKSIQTLLEGLSAKNK